MAELDTPEERVEAFLAALHAHDKGRPPRTEFEPRGLAGVPGPGGTYHDLMPEDVEALLAKARTFEVVDLARVTVKPGDTLLVRPKESTGITDADQAEAWAEYLREAWGPHFPGVKFFVLPLACEVAVIEGGEAGRCGECGQSVYLEGGRIGFHPVGEDGNQRTCPGAGREPQAAGDGGEAA